MNKKVICAIISTVFAWFVGMVIDANIDFGDPQGFMCLRILFPILVMGAFVINNNKKDGE